MQKMSRKNDRRLQMERLQRRHGALDQQIAQLDSQRFLTTSEQIVLHDLKRQKLATKDQLVGLRGQLLDAE
ncbi:MAG: YdcH family protein [Polyangiales bacterium]